MTKKHQKTRKARALIGPSFNLAIRMSIVLGTVPSLIWASLYLLSIPLFAAFYTFLPEKSFYQSTIVHDVTYKQDQKLFEGEIEAWAAVAITSRLSEAIERVTAQKPKEVSFYADYSPGQFWPRLLASAKFNNSESLDLHFQLGAMTHVTYTKNLDYVPPKITEEYSEGFDLMAQCKSDEGVNCKAQLVEQELKPDRYFSAPLGLNDRVFKLRTEASGLNATTDLHTFGRMLYLSAVTITTLGYGDIVPLTDAARIAISCEAVGGIILIGLFLNALAYERQSSNS